ncbi:MAG: Type fimbrial biosis protein PilY1 [bacterium]|nr:Type fimbrial biosis protein PilY1 [bacterium]
MRVTALLVCIFSITPTAAHAASPTSSPECGGSVSTTTLDPTATSTSFGPGSLIIPMDSCYNADNVGNSGPTNIGGSCGAGPSYACYNNYTGGNVRLPFGVIYLLAENNVPVSVILNQSKIGLTDADFSITPPAGSSAVTVKHLTPSASGYTTDAGVTCGTNTVYYGGMPFVVEASFAAQALQVITAFNNANANLFTPVTFHVSNYGFSAPVLAVMSSRPKPVLIDASPLDTFFSESGIISVAASGTTFLWMSGSGSSYGYTWPGALAPFPTGCSSAGACTSLVDSSSNRVVDVVWTSNQIGNVNNWSSMGTYFQKGGTVLALDAAVSFEAGTGGKLGGGVAINTKGAQKGPFCPAVVTSNANPLTTPGPTSEYPASNRFLQLDDLDLTIQGNGGGVDGSSGWDYSSAPASRTQALSNGTGYEAIAGHPMVSGTQTQGNLVYLASLNSWHGNSGNKDGGLHILYNTLLAGGGSNTSCASAELTRSSSVANLVTLSSGSTAYAEYLGSFDWAAPASGASLGNVLYQANPADYPYTTGHFREYKPAGTYTATSTTTSPTCDPASATSPCNWDAATKMKPFAQRKIFVGTGSFGAYTLTAASSLTAGDNTIKYVSQHLDVKDSSGTATGGILGGVDWSTAAVIEWHNGFTARPTIAYVGARDGMLHAFCVAPGSGSTTCYGAAAGEEIWAIIPPGIKKVMDSAYNSGSNMDWSRVNVGGAIRVADMKDTFGGVASAVTRTVLIVGMHDSGYVDALDISNPDPSNVNQDGFRFLWENDGTHVASGVTSMPMGPTVGATVAQVNASSGTGVAIVTSATCFGQGMSTTACPTTVTPGYNSYAIRLADGVIVSDEQKLYTLASSLFGAPIANDPPALPTALDVDGDGTDETVYVSTLDGKVRRYTLTAQGVTAPTLAMFDSAHPASSVYNANTVAGCTSGIACQPIGVSPTIVRSVTGNFDVVVATGGADWARQPTDAGATINQSYLTGFDATTLAQFPTAPFKLGGIQPPASAAGGSSPGTTNQVPLSLRAYAQLTVAGSDLYANVTSISVGSMQQLLLPLVTPGTYGTVLKWSNINSTTPTAVGSLLAAGTAFAGGAGSVIETDTPTSTGELFIPGISSSIRIALSGSSSSLRTAADAITKPASGNRPFTTVSWFDLAN